MCEWSCPWPTMVEGAQGTQVHNHRSAFGGWSCCRSDNQSSERRHLHALYSPLAFPRTVLMGPGSRQTRAVQGGVRENWEWAHEACLGLKVTGSRAKMSSLNEDPTGRAFEGVGEWKGLMQPKMAKAGTRSSECHEMFIHPMSSSYWLTISLHTRDAAVQA